MKKAVIICILSLSVCLSQAALPEDGKPVAAAASNVPNTTVTDANAVKKGDKITATEPTSPVPNQQAIPATPEAKGETKQGEKTAADKHTEENKNNKTETVSPNASDKHTETKKKEMLPNETVVSNGTSVANETSLANGTSPNSSANEKAPAGAKPEASTPKAVIPKTTEAPKVTEKPTVQTARGFDGGSFIGGIILTLGLLAIGFMGYKYYKNHTERNYHTL